MKSSYRQALTKRSSSFAFLIALGFGAAVSGCSSSSSTDTTEPTSISAADTTDATSPSVTQTSDTASAETTPAAPVDTLAPTNLGETSTVAPPAEAPADGKAFTDCLKENGIVLPEGFELPSAVDPAATPDIPAGVDVGTLQAAMGKCADKMPAAAS